MCAVTRIACGEVQYMWAQFYYMCTMPAKRLFLSLSQQNKSPKAAKKFIYPAVKRSE